ncbi:MAG: NAD(P)H-dependent oxidoreductase subunit E [Thermomicrobiales bacterium]
MAQTVQVSEQDLDKVRELMRTRFQFRDHEEARELILAACQDVQQILGWVPHEAAEIIGDHLGTTANHVYGLLTFYADFRTQPPGNHVMLVCHGTACFVSGSQRLIDELQTRYGVGGDETTADGELTVQIVNGCLGVCDRAPLVQFDHHDYYGELDVESFNQAIAEVIQRGPAARHHDAH